MKEYYGFPEVQDGQATTARHVNVRSGKSPTDIVYHKQHGSGVFQWGVECGEIKDLARSIIFNALGVYECPTAPDKCECPDSLWTDKVSVFDGFEPELVYTRVVEEILMPLSNDKMFKMKQVALLDFVFDAITEQRQISEFINEKAPELV